MTKKKITEINDIPDKFKMLRNKFVHLLNSEEGFELEPTPSLEPNVGVGSSSKRGWKQRRRIRSPFVDDAELLFNFETTPNISAKFGLHHFGVADTSFLYKEISEKIENVKQAGNLTNNEKVLVEKLVKYREEFEKYEKYYELIECGVDLSRILQEVNTRAGEISQYLDSNQYSISRYDTNWISHNGIKIPVLSMSISQISEYSWTKTYIDLQDNLRPEISLSRERLRYLTWNVCSVVAFSLLASKQKYSHLIPDDFSVYIPESDIEDDLSLGKILNDPLLRNNLWSTQKIIPCIKDDNDDSEYFSLDEIKKKIIDEKVVTVGLSRVNDFINLCAKTLIQMNLSIRLRLITKQSPYREKYTLNLLIIDTITPAVVHEGQMLFPPLFFVPYENKDVLWEEDANYLNQEHPFSKWFIKNSFKLKQNYPGIFSEIKEELEKIRDPVHFPPTHQSINTQNRVEKNLEVINGMIKRLQGLDQSLVTEDAFIKNDAILYHNNHEVDEDEI